MNQEVYDKLVSFVGRENILVDEPMKNHTTFRVGGNADYFVTPQTIEQVSSLVKYCFEIGIPYFIIGNGSNLLVSDDGYRGVIIQIYKKMNTIAWMDYEAIVKAGCLLSKFGNEAAERGLSGFEFGTGIPGTMGGAVTMNAGAYGGEMKDCIVAVRMMDKEGNIRWYEKDEMEFGYRTSLAAARQMIVLEVKIRLERSNRKDVKEQIEKLTEARKSKQPLEYPSAGSTFKRPEGYFAGKLIQDAGLSGYTVGGASVSTKHAGFVINNNNATAADVMAVIRHVQQEVLRQFGVELALEVKQLGKFS